MNCIYKDLDNKLLSIKGLKWLPYIGKCFFNQKERLLIIGESHYSDGDFIKDFNHNLSLAEDKEFTRNMIVRCQNK